jgi:glycosyltransferase involved in cell wall biosynthesis
MKILWLTNIPSPYRVEFFNEIGKYCDLTVLFERACSSERDVSWTKYQFVTFKGVIKKGINIGADKAVSLNTLKYLKKESYDHIVISNPLTPTGIIAIHYMRMKDIPYSIVSDGGFPKGGKGFKEVFKKHILKGASFYFSTASVHDKYYSMYGAKSENIVRYPFTSLKNDDILKKPLERAEKEKYKKNLGMKEEKIILSIGQFIHRKGYDILLKASKKLGENVGVYIIGGTPTEEYLKIIDELKINNVHFEGFKTKEQLSEYFMAVDLFVLPTREDIWGLVINEAMAYGLPIVTTSKCVAGLELVRNNENGFIVPVNDSGALKESIKTILESNTLLECMAKNNLSKIRHYTIENMARKHIEIFCEIKDGSR